MTDKEAGICHGLTSCQCGIQCLCRCVLQGLPESCTQPGAGLSRLVGWQIQGQVEQVSVQLAHAGIHAQGMFAGMQIAAVNKWGSVELCAILALACPASVSSGPPRCAVTTMSSDFSEFAEPGFDVKAWINRACGQAQTDEEPLDRHLAELEMRLQLTAEEIEASLHELSVQAMRRIPFAVQEIYRLQGDIQGMQDQVCG